MDYLTSAPLNLYLKQKKNRFILVAVFFTINFFVCAQNRGAHKFLFYNVENMFDHVDDSLVNDDEFTPDGLRHWTSYKASEKINNVARVIIAAGELEPVDFIGLVEVENRSVLNQLIYNSPLKSFNYALIHRESPDRRGIDVALLYNRKTYIPLKNRFLRVNLLSDPEFKTREILYSKGVINGSDTLHVFVNHWPSRYGGELKSKPLRCAAAKTLKRITDSLLTQNKATNIIIAGDFNDYPEDESITDCLGAKASGNLINLALQSSDKGSYKYQGRWGFLDQIIVSEALYKRKDGLSLASGQKVISPSFLLEVDTKYTGFKPKRAFIGFKYNKGFSDHLPVMIILK